MTCIVASHFNTKKKKQKAKRIVDANVSCHRFAISLLALAISERCSLVIEFICGSNNKVSELKSVQE